MIRAASIVLAILLLASFYVLIDQIRKAPVRPPTEDDETGNHPRNWNDS